MNIGFIGAGNMANAIIRGYLPNAQSNKILAYDISSEKLIQLEKLGIEIKNDLNALLTDSDYLFLAIKPQNITEVLLNIKDTISKDTIIVSIVAGITEDYIKKTLGYDAKIVLVMPNTPILLGEGASVLSKISPTTDEEFDFVCSIFKSSGKIEKLPSNKINEIIPINGSSPAFIYEFAKYFVSYAKDNNINEHIALNLFAQTLIGSATMITNSGYDLDTLIEMVSSKGGATIEGLRSFRNNNTENIIKDACKATTQRAYELSK